MANVHLEMALAAIKGAQEVLSPGGTGNLREARAYLEFAEEELAEFEEITQAVRVQRPVFQLVRGK